MMISRWVVTHLYITPKVRICSARRVRNLSPTSEQSVARCSVPPVGNHAAVDLRFSMKYEIRTARLNQLAINHLLTYPLEQ